MEVALFWTDMSYMCVNGVVAIDGVDKSELMERF